MNVDFASIYNHHEQSVFERVAAAAPRFPVIAGDPELLADVACVALNHLAPRYIRHRVDYLFYLTERERADHEQAVAEAVEQAFSFVRVRSAVRARACA